MPNFECTVCGDEFSVPQAALDKYKGWEPKFCRTHSPAKKKSAPRKKSGGGGGGWFPAAVAFFANAPDCPGRVAGAFAVGMISPANWPRRAASPPSKIRWSVRHVRATELA